MDERLLEGLQALLTGYDAALGREWRAEDRVWRGEDVKWREAERAKMAAELDFMWVAGGCLGWVGLGWVGLVLVYWLAYLLAGSFCWVVSRVSRAVLAAQCSRETHPFSTQPNTDPPPPPPPPQGGAAPLARGRPGAAPP
jgi:hypothetical protein